MRARMTRQRLGPVLTWLAAAGYFATAWIHSTGYDSISELSATGPVELRALVPALWISFSLNLFIIGFMLVVVAVKAPRGAALLVSVAAGSPLSAAVLQLWYLGFIPPTAILIGIGVIALLAGLAYAQRGASNAYAAA